VLLGQVLEGLDKRHRVHRAQPVAGVVQEDDTRTAHNLARYAGEALLRRGQVEIGRLRELGER